MAIVINGNGTVTGLAVGGLPDGTVDAGTLATNSVDSAELIDGAVDNSHMAAMAASKLTGALPAISAANLTAIPAANITGTLPAISGANLTGVAPTRATMPAGSILQVVTSEFSTDTSTTNTSSISTGHTVSITPTASDSKMLIMLTGSGGHHGASGGWLKLDMHRSSSGGSAYIGSGEKWRAQTTSATSLASYSWFVLDTVPSAAGITYTIYYRSNHSSNTTYYRWSDKGNPLLTVMEIAV